MYVCVREKGKFHGEKVVRNFYISKSIISTQPEEKPRKEAKEKEKK